MDLFYGRIIPYLIAGLFILILGVAVWITRRALRLEQDLLAYNQGFADANRRLFETRGLLTLNLVSSPGSGKTSLLARTLEMLREEMPLAVIEGDQQTSRDADRIRATGVKAVQINTGKGCHLDAHMVGHALDELAPAPGGLVFIENVGNLVCPSAFDLGEAHKVASIHLWGIHILSVLYKI